MKIETWKGGQLKPCTVQEFTDGLRRLAGWANEEFAVRSDPAGHIGERLIAAADLLDSFSSLMPGEKP